MSLLSPTNDELLINSIGFFIFSLAFFVVRVINSIWIVKQIHWDDILMLVTFVLYTIMLGLINASGHFATNRFPKHQLVFILANPEDVRSRIIGSILVVPLEQCMLVTIWSIKICVLGFIYRLTNRMSTTRRVLEWIVVYTVGAFVVMEICYYVILCRPFSQYWALLVQNPQCATYSIYYKLQLAFNLSSDLLIMAIPSSLIYRSQLSLKRQTALVAVFGLGFFTILSAVLTKYYSFSSPETIIYALWYIREASIAMWVGNIVCCWRLLQQLFHFSTLDDTQPGSSIRDLPVGEEDSAEVRAQNIAWFGRVIARIKHLKVCGRDRRDEERDLQAMGSISGVTVPPNNEDGTNRAAGEPSDPTRRTSTIHRSIFSLSRGLDDAGPALAYREAHKIA